MYSPNFLLALFLASIFMSTSCTSDKKIYTEQLLEIKKQAKSQLTKDLDEFNAYKGRPNSDGPYNASNHYELLTKNVPYFSSSNKEFSKVYNYRWWMISKHFRKWFDPDQNKDIWVVTEFYGWPGHGSMSGAIPCPAGHQFYDLRWFKDPSYLKSYIEFYMKGHGANHNQRRSPYHHDPIDRPESHHYSSWMIDGAEAFLKIHPNATWRDSMLVYFEQHQKIWDEKFTVKSPNKPTDGLYKILDLYDGMEFTISATLPLIESDGAYKVYTADTWKDYYLGWYPIDQFRKNPYWKKFPKAFHHAYPLMYLVRPSINSYSYANLRSLGNLYAQKYAASGSLQDQVLSDSYFTKAKELQTKSLEVMWHKDDQFFYSLTAGDNAAGVLDKPSRVRESVGYTPWYFNMIPEGEKKYDVAWDMLTSPKGFLNTNGMTTAEIQHPLYDEQAYAWNGRGWPFQNSVVNKAYANYLKKYVKKPSNKQKEVLFDLISKLVTLHGKEKNIGEWYIPSNGKEFGGVRDYFHSTFPDMVIEDLIGFTASHENQFSIRPLIPEGKMEDFYLGNLAYHGHIIDIVWKQDWDKNQKGNQSQLCVWVDSKLIATADDLSKELKVNLTQ